MQLTTELLDRTERLLTADAQAPAFRVPDPSPDPKSPQYVPDVEFSLERVARVVSVAEHLVHIKGDMRGEPILLEPWQVQHQIAPLFGWVRPVDGPREWVRVRQYGFLETGRKNGKTTSGAIVVVTLLVADDEPGAEVYTGATKETQARKLYNPARDMMLASPRLSGRVQSRADGIYVPRTGGEFHWTTEGRAESEHGGNVHGGVLDELHVHRSPDLLETIETGTGSRAQPLIAIFTTADEGATGTVYDERVREIEAMSQGLIDWDPTIYGAIYRIAPEDDAHDPQVWIKANPNLGVSKSVEYMEKQSRRARREPTYLPTFERLDLGRRRKSSATWLPVTYFDGCDHRWSIDELAGGTVWGGVDMSAVDDFTALSWWMPTYVESPAWGDEPARTAEGGVLISRIWVPQSGLKKRPRMRRQIEAWAERGWLEITDGDAIDSEAVKRQIVSDAEEFGKVAGIGFDPWNARLFAQQLQDDHGLPMVEISQTTKSLAVGAQELEKLVLRRAVGTDGNPVLRWMVSNTIARRDNEGRVRPDKGKSEEKIDAVAAAVTALSTSFADVDGTVSVGSQFVG
ncbi:MAG: terminase large subunit [Mycobacterium sp.]